MQAQAVGQTLHKSLDAYADHLRQTYVAPGGKGRVSQHGVTCSTSVNILKEHHADIPLDGLRLAELEAMLTYWANRPKGKKDRPVAPDTARDMIKRSRHFVKWLHRTPAFRLAANLAFPFEGRLADPIGPHRDTRSPLRVIRLLDVDSYEPEEMYGLICKAKQAGERIELPLDRIDVPKDSPNRQLIEDYRYWMGNWG